MMKQAIKLNDSIERCHRQITNSCREIVGLKYRRCGDGSWDLFDLDRGQVSQMVEWLCDWLEQSAMTCNLTDSAPIEPASAFGKKRSVARFCGIKNSRHTTSAAASLNIPEDRRAFRSSDDFPDIVQPMNRNYRAKMMALNVGRFAGLGVGNVPKRPRDSGRWQVPKRHSLRADFFDFETETGKNTHQCLSQNKNLTTRNDKYGSPQP